MKQAMFFKTIIYDVQPILGSTVPFLLDSQEDEESVTYMNEENIVKWLFGQDRLRNFLMEEFIVASYPTSIYFNILDHFSKRHEKPGDIDLLFVPFGLPQFSIAFECKKVKVVSFEGGAKVNNADKIRKAVIQANAYQSLGFSHTYLMIVILDDGRNLKTPNVALRQGKSELIERVFWLPYEEPLHPDIGIVFIYVSQITGRSINKMGNIGICVDKRARYTEQTSRMTEKINNFQKTMGSIW